MPDTDLPHKEPRSAPRAVSSTAASGCMVCGGTRKVVRFAATLAADRAEASDFVCTNARHGVHGEIVRCKGCGLVYTDPQPTVEELIRLYGETVDPTYSAEKAFRLESFRRLFDRDLKQHIGGGRALDIGCHIGAFVEVAAERGFDAWGIDPSAWAVREARAAGLQVLRGTLADIGSAVPEAFDLITIWDVIEHFAEPRLELERARDRLVPGGLLALTTMDVSSLFARILGPRWPWLMRMHLYYFSPQTLRRLLEETGFEVLDIRPCGRVVSLGYLMFKLASYTPRTARLAGGAMRRLGLARRGIPVNFRDIMMAIAQRR